MGTERDIPEIRDDGLQLEEHRGFQERFWKAERMAWVFFALVVATSLAGLTGSGGYLATATVKQADNSIDYPRISRWQGTDVIKVAMAPGGAERRITLSDSFFEKYEVEVVEPQANEAIVQAGRQTLVVKAEQGRPVTVRLHVRAESPGVARYTIAVDDTAASSLTSVILP